MNKKKLNLVRPIPEEEIAAQLAEDPDIRVDRRGLGHRPDHPRTLP